jgi:hypothetical protein
MQLMRAALAVGVLATGLTLGACAGLPIGPASLPPNLADQLDACGEAFTPMLPPPDAVSGTEVVQRLHSQGFPPFAPPGARSAAPVYGVLDNSGPTCRHGGLVPDGGSLEIWIVVWPDVSGGNGGQAWAIVDASTGEMIVGDGPPGG